MAIRIGLDAANWDQIDFLIIHPRYPMPFWPIMPFGCLALAQYADKSSHRAALWDCNLDPAANDEALTRLLRTSAVRWVGISLLSTQLGEARRLARLIRTVSPTTQIVAGGQHIAPSSAATFPEADVLVTGEGELAVARILTEERPTVMGGGAALPILANSAGQPLIHGEVISELDEIPLPDREVVRKYVGFGRFSRMGLLVARGCPFTCTFCHFEERSREARRYSPERVGELVSVAWEESGVDDVFFLDDIFTLSRKWVLDVCAELQRRNLTHIRYGCFSHVRVGSREIYSAMADAGFRQIQLGIESGDERIRRRMHKNFTDEQIDASVDLIKSCGMEPHCLFILGYTGETIETMQTTLRMAERLKTTAWFSYAQPLPGTEFLHEAEAEGTILERDLAQYGNQNIVYLPAGVTLEQMRRIQVEAEQLRQDLQTKFGAGALTVV